MLRNMQLSVPATAVELVDFAIILDNVCECYKKKQLIADRIDNLSSSFNAAAILDGQEYTVINVYLALDAVGYLTTSSSIW